MQSHFFFLHLYSYGIAYFLAYLLSFVQDFQSFTALILTFLKALDTFLLSYQVVRLEFEFRLTASDFNLPV